MRRGRNDIMNYRILIEKVQQFKKKLQEKHLKSSKVMSSADELPNILLNLWQILVISNFV